MREANHVLGIIHERGQRGLPVEDLYRQLFNPTLYLQAYGKIYRNDGATSRNPTRPNCARWDYPPGRINCCKK